MSNTLTTNPIVVVSAMSQSLKSLGAWSSIMPVRVTQVYWLNPAAVGDTFTIIDEAGNTVSTGRCESANQSQIFVPLKRTNQDVTVTQISSGSLYIHLA